MQKESKEAWMRIVVLIVSGIILYAWYLLVIALFIFNLIYTIIKNKRNLGIAEFCNLWIAQAYAFFRYMAFTSNKRPFPFTELRKEVEPVEKPRN